MLILSFATAARLSPSSAEAVLFEMQCSVVGDCFLGSSVVDWLLKWHFADSRHGACRLAEKLLHQAHIQPLLPGRDKKTAEVAPTASKSFYDSSDFYYRFVRTSIPIPIVGRADITAL